jgi:beta-lactamase superfamily II metal-dependent hydrolase
MSPQPKKSVIVRMYNVGFGDSFLLLFPAPDGRRRKVLIDCGYHRASRKPPSMKEVVERIINDVTDNDGVPRIDIVVATHRHMDHVHGFADAAWGKVEVGEVWMPWTEHPKDEEAKKIRNLQSLSSSKVHKAAARKFKLSLTQAEREEMEKAMVLTSNNLVNAKAMKTLHEGFSKNKSFALRRYLPGKEDGETITTAKLPGVKIHVIGPSRRLDEITTKDVEEEMYHLVRLPDTSPGEAHSPFRAEWKITPAQFKASHRHLALSKGQMSEISQAVGSGEFAAAAKLDYSVNNTSLMIMFEIGKGFLLFPGDSQWGNWNQALSSNWRELLEKTTFYKVGHHGSHNATPITFVEKVLGKNFWAMACTGPTQDWTDIIPRKKLLEKLRVKSDRVVRSDRQDVPDPQTPGFKRAAKSAYVEVEMKI